MNGLDVRGGGANSNKGSGSICIKRCILSSKKKKKENPFDSSAHIKPRNVSTTQVHSHVCSVLLTVLIQNLTCIFTLEHHFHIRWVEKKQKLKKKKTLVKFPAVFDMKTATSIPQDAGSESAPRCYK